MPPQIKVGDYIRLDEALYKPNSNKVLLSSFEVVQVLKLDKQGKPVLVRSLMDDDFALPKEFPYKKVKSGNIPIKATAKKACVVMEEITADIDQTKQARAFSSRALHKLQAVVSNAKVTDDPLTASRMAIASTCLLMSAMPGISTNHSARSIALANKLLSQG